MPSLHQRYHTIRQYTIDGHRMFVEARLCLDLRHSDLWRLDVRANWEDPSAPRSWRTLVKAAWLHRRSTGIMYQCAAADLIAQGWEWIAEYRESDLWHYPANRDTNR